MRRLILRLLAVLILGGGAGVFAFGPGMVERRLNRVTAHDPWPVSPAAQAMHERLVIADLHADSLLWDRDLTRRWGRGHADLPRLIAGNVAVQIFTTVTKSPAGLNYEQNAATARDDITLLSIAQLRPFRAWFDPTERALVQAEALAAAEAKAPEALRIIRSRADLTAHLAARAEGARSVGAILGAEGGHALSGDLANLDRLFDAGFRLIGLTHFFDNALGASLHGEAESGAGLTDFGRAVVARMAEKRMIIDLAHAGPGVVREVLAITDAPVMISHTGTHGHCPGPRNIPDALIREIAAKGGLIGIGFWRAATCDATPSGIAAAITAAIALVGADHVALGSDFDGAVETPFDAAELAALTQALIDAGLDEPVIAKVMGGNAQHFFARALPGG